MFSYMLSARNAGADALANKALDGRGKSFPRTTLVYTLSGLLFLRLAYQPVFLIHAETSEWPHLSAIAITQLCLR